MLCASCMVFAGCGDDGADADADAMGGGTGANAGGAGGTGGAATGGGGMGDQCATNDDCTAFGPGLVCNNGMCEFPPNCQAAGEACDPMQDAPAGFVCVPGDEGEPPNVCRVACDPWAADSGCEAGKWCLPAGDAVGSCEDSTGGTRTVGQSCADPSQNCADNHICLGYGNDANQEPLAYCQTYCRNDVNPGDPGACGDGFRCAPLSAGNQPVGYGACLPTCTPYVMDTGCPTDWWCEPAADGGNCQPPTGGTVPAGGSCLMAACQDGLICLAEEQDDMGNTTAASCFATCDTEAADGATGSCSQENGRFGCLGLTSNGQPLPFGYCAEVCDPWAADPAMEGCETNEWCFPATDTLGTCSDAGLNGTQLEGESCGENVGECQQRLLCIGGTCSPLCRVSAMAGESGSCEVAPGEQVACQQLVFQSGDLTPFGVCDVAECSPRMDPTGCAPTETCVAASVDNPMTSYDERDFGDCLESCTFDPTGSTGCDMDPNQYCQPRDFQQANAQVGGGDPITIGSDICVSFEGLATDPMVTKWPLEEGEDCEANGLSESQFCGPFSVCFRIEDVSQNVLCYDLCRRSAGAYNTPNHADCTQGADRSCIGNFLSLGEFGVGICLGGTFN